MALAVSAGGKVNATDHATITADTNAMLAKYGMTQDAPSVSAGVTVLSSYVDAVKTRLTNANNSASCVTKADLTGITSYAVGNNILASLANLLDAKALAITAAFCSCQCNYSCTCNCNYSCTCNCNYSCTCNCNNCSCNCDNYSCTCNCNYSCNCSCNCNWSCSCYCNYTSCM